MDDKQFTKLLELMNRGKKKEDEKALTGPELRERFGKAFLTSLKDER